MALTLNSVKFTDVQKSNARSLRNTASRISRLFKYTHENIDNNLTQLVDTVNEIIVTNNQDVDLILQKIANLGTFITSKNTYAELITITEDNNGNNLTVGDFAELSVRDDVADKDPGLYRYTATGWADTPFINYITANPSDVELTQDEVDSAFNTNDN